MLVLKSMKPINRELEANQAYVSLAGFSERYNKLIPAWLPQATESKLNEFRSIYPLLFKEDGWSIEKHRKRFMDWLVTHYNN